MAAGLVSKLDANWYPSFLSCFPLVQCRLLALAPDLLIELESPPELLETQWNTHY